MNLSYIVNLIIDIKWITYIQPLLKNWSCKIQVTLFWNFSFIQLIYLSKGLQILYNFSAKTEFLILFLV